MAMVCAQEFNVLFPNLALSMELPGMAKVDTLPLLAITEHDFCHSWQLQNMPDLETDALPLLAITEHTFLPFLATPEYANRYIATFGNH